MCLARTGRPTWHRTGIRLNIALSTSDGLGSQKKLANKSKAGTVSRKAASNHMAGTLSGALSFARRVVCDIFKMLGVQPTKTQAT